MQRYDLFSLGSILINCSFGCVIVLYAEFFATRRVHPDTLASSAKGLANGYAIPVPWLVAGMARTIGIQGGSIVHVLNFIFSSSRASMDF